MIRIGIFLGSTRPARNGEAVAKWVHQIAAKRNDAQFELVDIKDARHENSVNAMIDQVIAWSSALKPPREKPA
jgi:NAD(P)H-dependent FMN reductase